MTGNQIHALVQLERDTLHQLIAWGAMRGPILIIDCGCAFNATRALEYIHLQQVFYKRAMDHIHVSRPFTAYQLMASIAHLRSQPLPAGMPIVVLSALHLLYDDNIKSAEALRLLLNLMSDYDHIRQNCPILLDNTPPAEMAERLALFHKTLDTADQIIAPQPPPEDPAAEQMRLF